MKTKYIWILCPIFLTFGVFKVFDGLKKTNSETNEKSFVLIELFTSEGCSSCPPADEIFNEMVADNEPNVFAIAYHVDYWDRLGWKDAFSSSKFSDRQKEYANLLGNSGVYTPQMIGNGNNEFVGSDNFKLFLAKKNKLNIENQILLKSQIEGEKINLDYEIEGLTKNKTLTLVLIQKAATSEVKRGENTGRKLFHRNIALEICEIKLKENKGTTTFIIPSNLKEKEYFVTAFVKDINGNLTGITKS